MALEDQINYIFRFPEKQKLVDPTQSPNNHKNSPMKINSCMIPKYCDNNAVFLTPSSIVIPSSCRADEYICQLLHKQLFYLTFGHLLRIEAWRLLYRTQCLKNLPLTISSYVIFIIKECGLNSSGVNTNNCIAKQHPFRKRNLRLCNFHMPLHIRTDIEPTRNVKRNLMQQCQFVKLGFAKSQIAFKS
uniref:Uncharacterized protein n=1 Tax=Glossina austeni TaxID=7395 RepID=A0A1A9USL3_GLOAU